MEANQNKAEGFLKQGSILAVASILVRMIGLLYRIPMANIIGSEGNGIYSSAYEMPVMESIPRRLRYTIFY